jgi:HlyD family secretion protein
VTYSRTLLALVATAAAASTLTACRGSKNGNADIQVVGVERRTIIIDAQATGTVEPINVVEVKSKASGLITSMPVETGMNVRPGDLLVQVDMRDVQNQYNQSEADLRAAEARLQVSTAQKRRADEMFAARVITAQEHEAATLDFANAQANVVRARANLDLAQQRREDARVSAPVAGTIIEKTVSLGQVITSATGAFGGGTTLLKMADLGRVRVRALFNETDIGQIQSTQAATVVVDAYPDRRFVGLVEKIEPQAVVQQGVTMFPVLVTLDNSDGALKPGMNGEVSVLIDQRVDVLAIPNDAIRSPREAVATAAMLGLNPDSVQAQLRDQFGGRGGAGGARPPSAGGPGASPGRVQSTAHGEVDLSGQQGGQQGGGFQQVQVTEQQCAEIRAAFARKPDEQRKLDALMEQMRAGGDRMALSQQMRAIYESVGVDARAAAACRRLQAGGEGGQGGQRGGGAQQGGGQQRGAAPAQRGAAGAAPQMQVAPEVNGTQRPAGRTRSGLVFVAEDGTYKPRIVMLGASDFDYTEVVGGLQEGDQVALIAAIALQAQREQQNQRIRQNMGGIPGMQRQQPAGQGGATGGAGGGAGGTGGRTGGAAPR